MSSPYRFNKFLPNCLSWLWSFNLFMFVAFRVVQGCVSWMFVAFEALYA
jgi:hypothetical protein